MTILGLKEDWQITLCMQTNTNQFSSVVSLLQFELHLLHLQLCEHKIMFNKRKQANYVVT